MIVSLIPHTDFAPVPRVEIRIEELLEYDGGDSGGTGGGELDGGGAGGGMAPLDGGTAATKAVTLPAGTDRVTVWRRSQNRDMKVRGGVDRTFTGTFGMLDLEAGFDVYSTYELECWDGGAQLGRVPLGSAVLPWVGDPHGVLIQQPLDPSLHVVASNLVGSWKSMMRDARGELVLPQGASYPALIGGGPREGVKEATVDFGVFTRADAQAMWDTLGTVERPQLQTWLVRSHHGFLPRVFFCRVGALTEVDVNLRVGREWSRFQATVDEIQPPAPGLIVAPLSYDDLDVSFASYADMDAAFASYGARDTAWAFAGASG